MIRHILRGLGACVAAWTMVAASVPGTAAAFVRYRTTTGQLYSWRVKTVNILGYPNGLPSMTVDQITNAMTLAASAWSVEDPTNALCSFLGLTVTMQPVSVDPPAAAHDEVNTIAIRTGSWTAICSTSKDGKLDCHQTGELALTTVWSRNCGEIVEADIEVNADPAGSGFQWADLDAVDPGAKSSMHDLQNALTHEMGHFIGLDHTCVLNGAYQLDKNSVPIIPVDNLGNPVLDCDDPGITAAVKESTMFPSANPGDIDKRTLADDDHLGLCSIYPIGTNPTSCGLGTTGGCSVGAVTSGSDSDPSTPSRWRWLVVGFTGLSAVLLATRRGRARLARRRR